MLLNLAICEKVMGPLNTGKKLHLNKINYYINYVPLLHLFQLQHNTTTLYVIRLTVSQVTINTEYLWIQRDNNAFTPHYATPTRLSVCFSVCHIPVVYFVDMSKWLYEIWIRNLLKKLASQGQGQSLRVKYTLRYDTRRHFDVYSKADVSA